MPVQSSLIGARSRQPGSGSPTHVSGAALDLGHQSRGAAVPARLSSPQAGGTPEPEVKRAEESRRSRSRWPWGLLASIFLVVLIEATLAQHVTAFIDYMALAWRKSARTAASPVAQRDLLFLGDSLVKCGLLPSIIQDELGVRAYNLAIFGGQASSSYFLLRKAIEAGSRPRAVIVDFHPNLLAVAPRSGARYWSHLLDLRDGLDLAWNTLDVRLSFETLVLGWMPSIRDRNDLRKAILDSFAPEPAKSSRACSVLERNWQVNQGAHVVPVVGALISDPFGGGSSQKAIWTPRPLNIRYLERLLDLAGSHGIAVYWLMPPSTRAWQARRERLGLDASYERKVRELLGRHPNLRVLDGRHSTYGDRAFLDPAHLNRDGAASLSMATAQILARHWHDPARAARWESLPPFQRYSVPSVIEDLDQSKLALALPAKAAR